ncbi:hypothetical protein ACHAXN_012188 [Cyclotella atomus]
MSNAQELLSILNGRRPALSSTTTQPTSSSILNFKAGKMTTTIQPNGKYLVAPDTRRGELHVVFVRGTTTAGGGGSGGGGVGGHIQLEWKDRRTKTTVDTIHIPHGEDCTFERIETGRELDRVYLLQVGSGSAGRHFFWMQDIKSEEDEEICVKVNLYLGDVDEARKAAGFGNAAAADTAAGASEGNEQGGGVDDDQLLRIMQGALGGSEQGRAVTAVPGEGSIPAASPGQIDALGNILENLGLPQPGGTVPSGEHTTTPGGLTLADLQGAMAGLATASPVSSPPLSELASTDIIDESGILNDETATARLMALLPEGQRTRDALLENLRSPQVMQCLQRLTSALAEDASSFNSIIANFQLEPGDGGEALARGDPIEAFLNCLLRDVERKEGVKKEEGEEKDGDDEMDEES